MLLGTLIGVVGASLVWGIPYFRLLRTVRKLTANMKNQIAKLDEIEKRKVRQW